MSANGDDPFETFFNNESLSDRSLHIVEIEEVRCISFEENPNEVPSKKQKTCDKETDNAEILHEDVKVVTSEQDQEDHASADTRAVEESNDCLPVETDHSFKNIHAETLSNLKVTIGDHFEDDVEHVSAVIKTETSEPELEIEPLKDSRNHTAESIEVPSVITTNDSIDEQELGVEMELFLESHAASSVPSTTGKRHLSDVSSSSNVDVIEKIIVRETKVFVHSVILAAKSSYFKCLFSCGMRETNERDIRIEVKKGEIDDMLILLHCFYNKQYVANHSLVTVTNVCALAMRYCFDGLITTCLDILILRAKTLSSISDINLVVDLTVKVESQLPSYKEKCTEVCKAYAPTLLNHFLPMDETLERTPVKFYELPLSTMHLFLDTNMEESINEKHGNLYVYCIQQWLRIRRRCGAFERIKDALCVFIEKFTQTINMTSITGDFLTNIMTCEHSPLNMWSGYKDWYIKALQNYIYRCHVINPMLEKRYPVVKRRRLSKFVRNDNNADIFSLQHPVILNGFEISIYLRVRHDRKMQVIAKCKNILVSKAGFGKSSLVFHFRGSVKLNVNSNVWVENFPVTHEWMTFSYKSNNTMFAEMYSVCKLRPEIYNLAKSCGFILSFQLQQLN